MPEDVANHEVLCLHLSFFAAIRCGCQAEKPLIFKSASEIKTCPRCGRSYAVTKMQYELKPGESVGSTDVDISEVTMLHKPPKDFALHRGN